MTRVKLATLTLEDEPTRRRPRAGRASILNVVNRLGLAFQVVWQCLVMYVHHKDEEKRECEEGKVRIEVDSKLVREIARSVEIGVFGVSSEVCRSK